MNLKLILSLVALSISGLAALAFVVFVVWFAVFTFDQGGWLFFVIAPLAVALVSTPWTFITVEGWLEERKHRRALPPEDRNWVK